MNKVEIQLVASEMFYEFQRKKFASRIFYIVSLNSNIMYRNQLPENNRTKEEFKKQLYKVGFKLLDSDSLSRIRTIYISMAGAVGDFNFELTSKAIKKGWLQYFSSNLSSFLTNVTEDSVDVIVLDQNLFYDYE